MQNMIRLARGGKIYNVFFDINRTTQDYDNVTVRDGERIIPVFGDDLDSLKDTITEEVLFSQITLAKLYRDGNNIVLM